MKKKTKRPQQRRSNNAKKKSELNPNLLIKDAQEIKEEVYQSKITIDQYPVQQAIIDRLKKKGYVRPTEVQERTLDHLLKGKNMLGIAQTGTGKTAAFLVPIVEQLLIRKKNKSYALVVVPTRELALQVEEEFKSMTKGLGLWSGCFIGGTNINKDMEVLKRSKHLIVATPGRLLDLEGRGVINLDRFKILVLDEFDRMLDMGFARDVDRIVDKMHRREQTMLFSATLNPKQRNRIEEILETYETVKVATGQHSSDRVKQDIILVESPQVKFTKLISLLKQDDFSKVIVFDETKHRVKRLAQKLNKIGIDAADIQGNRSQNARQKALKDFKSGKIKVLCATDVAGRGIDVSDVSHVINYQIPMSYDSYIHRIGRTGRAGKLGVAITFVDHDNPFLNKARQKNQKKSGKQERKVS